jgi:hypothetical protein
VDHIFLKENAVTVPALLTKQLQPLIDEGFLHLSTLPGPKHPLQNRWYNRCSKPDMAGKHSWIAFIDLDEYVVVLDKCASPAHAAYGASRCGLKHRHICTASFPHCIQCQKHEQSRNQRTCCFDR